jgi:hypothetical protein
MQRCHFHNLLKIRKISYTPTSDGPKAPDYDVCLSEIK